MKCRAKREFVSGFCPIKRDDIVYNNKGITTVAKEQEMPIGEIIKGGSAYEAILGDVLKTEILEEVLGE